MGSTGAKVLGELGFEDGKNLSLYKSFPDCTLDLESGRIEAMVIDSFGGLDLIKNDKYVVVGEPLGAESNYAKIGIALRKEDKELQAKIQQAVDELIADGTLGKLAEQWIGEDITAGLK